MGAPNIVIYEKIEWHSFNLFGKSIYIRFGTKLYRQIAGIQMGTKCAPLVADLFVFCYERDFVTFFALFYCGTPWAFH